jgi:hypothetical protein
MVSLIVGIIVIIIAVVEWFGHITINHALAIIIGFIGVSILLGAFVNDRYHTRL